MGPRSAYGKTTLILVADTPRSLAVSTEPSGATPVPACPALWSPPATPPLGPVTVAPGPDAVPPEPAVDPAALALPGATLLVPAPARPRVATPCARFFVSVWPTAAANPTSSTRTAATAVMRTTGGSALNSRP